MGVKFQCGQCGTSYEVSEKYAGKRVKCRQCQAAVQVPEAIVELGDADMDTSVAGPLAGLLDEELAGGPALPGVGSAAAGSPFAASGPVPRTAPAGGGRRSEGGSPRRKPKRQMKVPRSAVAVGVCVLIVLLGLAIPPLGALVGAVAVIGGVGLLLVGSLWCLGVPFQEDILCGLMYLFVPFYSLYYLITRWPEMRKPFLVSLAGMGMIMASPLLMTTSILTGAGTRAKSGARRPAGNARDSSPAPRSDPRPSARSGQSKPRTTNPPARFKPAERVEPVKPTVWEVEPDPVPEQQPFSAAEQISIAIPSGSGDDVIFPSHQGRFVAVGRNLTDRDLRESWNLETMEVVGQISGKVSGRDPWVLSADGRYLACTSSAGRGNAEVWSFETGQQTGVLETQSTRSLDFLDFAGKDRLVTVQRSTSDLSVILWDLAGGATLREFDVPRGSLSTPSLAISPGGKYLVVLNEALNFYRLSDGDLAGKVPISGSGRASVRRFGSVAFSADGRELAVLVQGGSDGRLLCWDLQQGQLVVDLDLSEEADRYASRHAAGRDGSLEWMPDGMGWLVDGTGVIDRQTGGIAWEFPRPPGSRGPRRLLDERRLLEASRDQGITYKLATIDVPGEEIRTAAAALRAGGEVVDAELPPLTPVDRDSARKVTLPTTPVDWSLGFDPIAGTARQLARKPISLGPGQIQQVAFSGPKAGRAAALRYDTDGVARGSAGPYPHWVEHFDLLEGESLGRIDLPGLGVLRGASPDGTRAAVQTSDSRLDVWSLDDGQPLCGWRLDGQILWADFVDDDHLATFCEPDGLLELWQLPQCRLVYALETGQAGSPLFSPGRKYLVVPHAGKYQFLDPLTGQTQGDLPAPAGSEPYGDGRVNFGAGRTVSAPQKNTVAFSSDRRQLAGALRGSTGTILAQWDLSSGRLVETVPCAEAGRMTAMRWAGPRQLLVFRRSDALLVDLDRKATVWQYRIASGNPLGPAPDDRQWVTIGSGAREAVFLAAFAYNDPAVLAQVDAALPPEPQPVLAPGTPVTIDAGGVAAAGFSGDFHSRVEEDLRKSVQGAGLTVGGGQGVRLVASVTRGESVTREYKGFGGSGRSSFSVTVSGTSSRAALVDAGGKVLWERKGSQSANLSAFQSTPADQDPATYIRQESMKRQRQSLESFFASLALPGEMYRQPTHGDNKPGLGETIWNLQAMFGVERRPVVTRRPGGVAGVGRSGAGRIAPGVGQRPGASIDGGPQDEASGGYARRTHVNLIAGDHEVLVQRMRWFPGGKRPTIGLRWGLGLQLTGNVQQVAIRTPRDVAKLTGPAVPTISQQVQQRFDEGKFGDWPKSGDPQLQQGAFLGLGKQPALIDAAKRQGLGAAVVANLTFRPLGLTGRTETRMTVRLIDVAEGKVLWTSKMLTSTKIAAAQRTGGDPAGELVRAVMDEVDKSFVLVPMPSLEPVHVKGRVQRLAEGLSQEKDPDKLLPVLAELRYYVVKQLLTSGEATELFDRILGTGKGGVLATGSPAERRTALSEWLK